MTSLETLIAQLKEAAAKATPGPWEYFHFKYNPNEYGVHVPALAKEREDGDGIHGISICRGMDGGNAERNSEYIALCSPENILTLITELERLREMEREARDIVDDLQSAECRYRSAHDMHGDGHPTAGYCWDKMRQAGDRARAFLSKWAAP